MSVGRFFSQLKHSFKLIKELLTANQELLEQIQQQTEKIALTVVAYEALTVKGILNIAKNLDNPESPSNAVYIDHHFKQALMKASDGKAFTEVQAAAFVNRYKPTSALDDEGAGAIILRDTHTQTNIGLIRGSDFPANIIPDSVADLGISRGNFPADQGVKIDNFFARETAPKGMPVSQLSLGALTLQRESDAKGTGRAEGGLSLTVGHSKGGPIAAAIGALYKADTFTVDAPNTLDVQSYVDDARKMTGRSANLVGTNTINLDTTGISIISQLHGDLPRENRTLMLAVA